MAMMKALESRFVVLVKGICLSLKEGTRQNGCVKEAPFAKYLKIVRACSSALPWVRERITFLISLTG